MKSEGDFSNMPGTIVALYGRLEDARAAVDALIENGFTHADISLVARDTRGEKDVSLSSEAGSSVADDSSSGAAAGAGAGALIGGLGGLLAGLGALAIPGIGPVLAAGPIAAALAGAGVGAAAGGLLGALVDLGIPSEQAEGYAEGIHRGGTLVAVRTFDTMADEAAAVLNRFNPVQVNRQADRQRIEQQGALDEAPPFGEQPMNQEAESWVPSEDIQQDAGLESSDQSGGTPGLHRLGEGGAVIGIEMAGHAAYAPDEHESIISMQDADRESRRAERAETPGSGTTAGYDPGQVGKGKTDYSSRSVDYEQGTGFDAYEPLYRQHYNTSYSQQGRSYEELRPAYAFGYGLANNPRFKDLKWQEIEGDARNEWKLSHANRPWNEVKDAIREAWEAVVGWD